MVDAVLSGFIFKGSLVPCEALDAARRQVIVVPTVRGTSPGRGE
jgi:hypothetical protein